MPSENELFPAEFLTGLHALQIAARRVPAGGRPAEQASRARGAGIELSDSRPYAAGDEFRAIDWRAWQRLDRLFVRVFHEDRDLPLYFLIDRSASMLQENRLELAKTAAKQAVELLTPVDKAGVLAFGSNSEWISEIYPCSDKDKPELLRRISTLKAEGQTNM